jgi:hypothetical protein
MVIDFLYGHMDYILSFALTYWNAFFVLISFQYFLHGLNKWYIMENKYGLKKLQQKV